MALFLWSFVKSAGQYVFNIVQYKIVVDGVEKQFVNPIVNLNDRIYLPLREMADLLGIDIIWDEKDQTIHINTAKQSFSKNLFIFIQNGKYGYMDKNGNIIINPQFDFASDFVEGIAKVGKYVDDWKSMSAGSEIWRWGFINSNGDMITPIKFIYAWDFNEGLALVKETDGTSYYIDKEGKKSPQKVIGAKFFIQGFMPKLIRGGNTNPPMPNSLPEIWSYIDNTGELATNKEFEDAKEFSDGVAIVKNNGKYGVIDSDFNIVIDYKYDDLLKVDSVLFAAKKGEKWGLIDISDKLIADFNYAYIGSFSEGMAPVNKLKINGNGTFTDGAYINKDGKIILDSKFSLTDNFLDGFACVCDKESGKYGVIDNSGKYVIEPKYYYLSQDKSGLIKVKDKPGIDYYYIDLQENKIVPK